jgi:hypothetical protein
MEWDGNGGGGWGGGGGGWGGGGGGSTLELTVFAKGYIRVSDTAYQVSHPQGGSIALMAGTDLQIEGGSYQGLLYARHQMRVDSNPTIAGQLIARADADTAGPGGQNLVSSRYREVLLRGDADVTYEGGGFGSGGPTKVIWSWRECRGANPTNPCS